MHSASRDDQVKTAVDKYTAQLVATSKRHSARSFWLGTIVGAAITIIFVVAVGSFYRLVS